MTAAPVRSNLLFNEHLIPFIIVNSSHDGAASDGKATSSSSLCTIYYCVTVG